MIRDRRVKDTDQMTYLLEKAPRQLIEDARAKCKRQDPPESLKARILALLKEWTYRKEPQARLARPERNVTDPEHLEKPQA